MANRVAGKIKLQSVDELLGVPEISGTQEIEIVRIHAFPNHPFKVLDDERMNQLVDSIRENGILNGLMLQLHGVPIEAEQNGLQRDIVESCMKQVIRLSVRCCHCRRSSMSVMRMNLRII